MVFMEKPLVSSIHRVDDDLLCLYFKRGIKTFLKEFMIYFLGYATQEFNKKPMDDIHPPVNLNETGSIFSGKDIILINYASMNHCYFKSKNKMKEVIDYVSEHTKLSSKSK